MILSFSDAATEAFFRRGVKPRAGWQTLVSVAARKLDMLDNAQRLTDLKAPPKNSLEALNGDRAGQYSIRLNDQWRVCFRWTAAGPEDVQIVDYH